MIKKEMHKSSTHKLFHECHKNIFYGKLNEVKNGPAREYMRNENRRNMKIYLSASSQKRR